MLTLYSELIELRNKEPALHLGNYVPVFSNQQLIIFKREAERHNGFLIALNLTARPASFRQDGKAILTGEVVVETSPDAEGMSISKEITLGGDEGLVIRLA